MADGVSMRVAKFVGSIKTAAERTSETGSVIYRVFHPSSRYRVDFADDFHTEGWEQYDTDQDAEYFGVWVNRTKFMTLNYAEGDWTLVACEGEGAYNAQIRRLNDFYGEGRVARVIDQDGTATDFVQDRSQF